MELDKCAVSLAARADSLEGFLLGHGTAKLMRGLVLVFLVANADYVLCPKDKVDDFVKACEDW